MAAGSGCKGQDESVPAVLAMASEQKNNLKIPSVDLTGKDIPVDVLKEIPEEAAIFYKFVPISKSDKALEVGMLDPDDLKAREALRFLVRRSGLEPKIFLVDQVGFDQVLKQYRTLRGEVQKALKELATEIDQEERIEPDKKADAELAAEQIVAEAPITKIVAVILRHAAEGRASDVHIEPTEKEVKVRFRVDGVLYTSLILPKDVHAAIVSRIKILSNAKIDETRIPQDGRFSTTIGGKKIDFRVSTFPTVGGEKVVMRVLDSNIGLKGFADLGLIGYNLKVLEKAIAQPFGMVLITGPTGSGKTTTLYSILGVLNQEAINIISLEDPVEYYVEGVNQSQVRPEINYTFASGLRHILRQDPDVIMVGEIRDEETAELAIHAALTGHIVLSTLHTNDAMGVIPRLIDMGVGAFLLPTSLNLAIAQRLVRRLCEKCKKEIEPPKEILEVIEREWENMSPVQKKNLVWKKPYQVCRPVGCKFCGGKGVKGRIAIYEMLAMTPQLEQIIIQGPTEGKIKEEAQRQGMVTMKQDGISKALAGFVSFEEMLDAVEVETLDEKI